MCARRKLRSGAPVPRPRWRILYLIGLSVTAASFGAVGVANPLRVVLACVIGVVAGIAAFGWIAANRVALDELDWCACASASVPRVRVVMPRPTGATPARFAPVEDDSLAMTVHR